MVNNMGQDPAGMGRWELLGIAIQAPDFRNLGEIPT
jgi:hypothetical protein